MTGFFEAIAGVMLNVLQTLGYFGVAIEMLIESCCIPLPSELILPVAGSLVSHGALTIIGANIAAAAGSIAGSLIAYGIGFFGGRPLIVYLIEKYGKYLFISVEHFEKAEMTFNKRGPLTVLIGRVLPIIRTFISLPAGIARMNLGKFVMYSLIGMLPWNFLMIWLGYTLGENYEAIISPVLHKFDYLIVIICVAVLAFVVYKFIKFYKKNKQSQRG